MLNENIIVTGIGFACVDIIGAPIDKRIQLGGTTGNVIAILSKLSLQTNIFLPSYNDESNSMFQRDLRNKGVNIIQFLKTSLRTPRIIEIINNDMSHKFLTTCPECKQKLNEIVLPNEKHIIESASHIINSNVIFFDRISPGVKKAIEIARQGRTWSFYEPNGCRFYNQLLAVSKTVDIIKFSDDRLNDSLAERLREDLKSEVTKLIIVSLGSKGVKYCYKKDDANFSDWNYIMAIKLDAVIDTSGAGDWMTAAFLYFFLQKHPNRCDIHENDIGDALQLAQEMASFSCGFIGAQELFNNENLLMEFNDKFKTNISFSPKIQTGSYNNDECPYCGI